MTVISVLSRRFKRQFLQIAGSLQAQSNEVPGFVDVWDLFSPEYRSHLMRKEKHIANSPAFNGLIMLGVVINTALVGIEVDSAKEVMAWDRIGFVVIEGLFCLFFTMEMMIRVDQQSWGYFQDHLNLLDYSLVIVSWLDVATSASTYRERVQLASTIRVFRFVRIVRLAEGSKSGLLVIARGLYNAVEHVLQLSVITAVFVFVMAVVLTSLVAQDAYALSRWPQAKMYAGSVWRSTITVMQLATLDFWSEVAIRLFEISPLSLVTIVFTLFLLNFGVINHLVAIMVDRVSNISGEAQEMQEKLLSKAHDALIKALESDLRAGIGMDGKLSMVAFKKLIQMPAVNQKLQLMGISDEEAEAFFDIMDGERHGGITAHQFVVGLSKAKGKAKSLDMCKLICVVNRQTSRATKLVNRVQGLIDKVDALQKRFNDLGKGLTLERMTMREQDERLGNLKQRKEDTDLFFQAMELQRQYAQARVKLQ